MKNKKKDETGTIRLSGSVHLAMTPDAIANLIKGEDVGIVDKNLRGFHLQVDRAEKNAIISLSPWIDLAEADVLIDNSVREQTSDGDGDEFSVYKTLDLFIQDGADDELELSISPRQAAALIEILTNYIKARDACHALMNITKIKHA
ncbi:MAG: hypothetical protein ABSG19_12385 [Candidatus Aminicenantales bacterium]